MAEKRDWDAAFKAARERCEKAALALELAEDECLRTTARGGAPPLARVEWCRREKEAAELAYAVLIHS